MRGLGCRRCAAMVIFTLERMMTVKELIKKLQSYGEDREVWVRDHTGSEQKSVAVVAIRPVEEVVVLIDA